MLVILPHIAVPSACFLACQSTNECVLEWMYVVYTSFLFFSVYVCVTDNLISRSPEGLKGNNTGKNILIIYLNILQHSHIIFLFEFVLNFRRD